MRLFLLSLLVVACSTAPPEVWAADAGARLHILVTAGNATGKGIPGDYVQFMTGAHVMVWLPPEAEELTGGRARTIIETARKP